MVLGKVLRGVHPKAFQPPIFARVASVARVRDAVSTEMAGVRAVVLDCVIWVAPNVAQCALVVRGLWAKLPPVGPMYETH